MRPDDVRRCLRAIGAEEGLDEHRLRDGVRDGVAFLRCDAVGIPGRWAVVSSPGDRWVSLDTDQGFGWDAFDEGISDAELLDTLRELARVAGVYCGEPNLERVSGSRVFGTAIRITTPNREYQLARSLGGRMSRLWRRP